MNKKLLASLLVTPMALPVLGAIPVPKMNPAGWEISGIPGGNIDIIDGHLSCPVGTGILAQTIDNLPQGTYKFGFTASDNIAVKVNGMAQTDPADITVTLPAGGGSITIEVTGSDPAMGFSFTCSKLMLDFDFEACEKTLAQNLGKLVLDAVVPEAPEADDLNSQKKALDAAIKALGEKIVKIDQGTPDTIDLYAQYELWATPNKLQQEVDALTAQVEAYNDSVAKANLAYSNTQKNQAYLDQLNICASRQIVFVDNEKAHIAALSDVSTVEGVPSLRAYVKSVTDSLMTEIEADVKTYADAIKEVYTTENMVNSPAELQKQLYDLAKTHTAICTEISNFHARETLAKKDYAAYLKYLEVAEQARKEFAQVQTSLTTIQGVSTEESIGGETDYTSVYNDVIGRAQSAVNNIYDSLQFIDPEKGDQNITGAAEKLPVFEEELNGVDGRIGAIAQAQAQLDAVQQLATEQNTLYGQAKTYVDGVEEQGKTLLALNIVGPQKTKYDEAIAAYQAALAAYKEVIAKDYVAHKLANVDGIPEAKALDDALAALGYFYQIANLQDQLDALKEYIGGLSAANDLEDTVDIASKFNNADGTFDDIQDAINSLIPGATLDAKADGVVNTQKALDDAYDTAGELVKWFKQAKADLAEVTAAWDFLNGVIAAKWIVEVDGKPIWNKETFKDSDAYRALLHKIVKTPASTDDPVAEPTYTPLTEEWADLLAKAAADPSQRCWEAAKALSGQIEASTFLADEQAALAAFEEASTCAQNYAYANDLYENAANILKSENAPYGSDQISDTAVLKDLDAAKTAIDEAAQLEGKEMADGYTDADGIIKDALEGSIKAFLEQVDILVANQKAYDKLAALIPPVNDAITALEKFNQDTSLTPAKEYFTEQITGSAEGSLQSQSDALAQEMLDALHAALDTETNATALFDALSKKAEALDNAINAMHQRILTNESAHNAELIASDNVRNYIDREKTRVSVLPDDLAGLIQEYLADLQDITDQLTALDREDTGLFAEGACDPNDGMIEKYEALLAQAKELVAGEKYKPLADPIAYQNDYTVGTLCDWVGVLANLKTCADNAVVAYNRYALEISDTAYRDYLNAADALPTHRGIFEYWQKIQQLKQDAEAWVAEQNKAGKAFTKETYQKEWVSKADVMGTELLTMVSDMVAHMNQMGQAWYAEQEPVAASAIADAQSRLEAAGVTADNVKAALTKANNYLDSAHTAYADADDALKAGLDFLGDDTTWKEIFSYIAATPGKVMDPVTADLMAVPGSIDIPAAITGQWNESYDEAQETLSDLQKRIDACTNASEDVKAAQTDAFNKAAAAVTELNTTPATSEETLKDKLDTLADLLKQATAATEAIEANNKANIENQAAYDKFLAALGSLDEDYAALAAYANSMAGGLETNLVPIKGAVLAAKHQLKVNSGAVIANTETIQSYIDTAKAAIENGYASVRSNELLVLFNKTSKQLKVAYNNAEIPATATLSPEELNAAHARILELEANLQAASAPQTSTEFDLAFYTAFQDDAVAIETEMCGLIQYLSENCANVQGADTNPQQTALDAVNGAYQLAENALGELTEYTTRCLKPVQDKYRPILAAIAARMEAINADIEKANINIIARQYGYETQIAQVAAWVADLKTKIEAAEAQAQAEKAKVDASNGAYETLTAQLDDYTAQLDSLKADIASMKIAGQEGTIANVEQAIADAAAQLAKANESASLTADSILPNTTDIESGIADLALVVARVKADGAIVGAGLSIEGITLPNTLLPEVKERLENEKKLLDIHFAELTKAYGNGKATAGVDEFNAWTEQALAISAQAQNIRSQATAPQNNYTFGDVNDEPDGDVNVTDILTILRWIGEGTTYADLSMQQAMAAGYQPGENRDKTIGAGILSAVIQVVMDGSDATGRIRAHMVNTPLQGSDMVSAELIASENGLRTFAVTLTGNETYTNGVLDLRLSAGMEIVSVEAGNRAESHNVTTFERGGSTRVVLYSDENTVLKPAEGSVIIVTARGTGNLYIDNAEFANREFNTVRVAVPEPSALDRIYETGRSLGLKVYNVAGQLMNGIQRGINIIRHSDGSVTKERH